MQSLNLHEVALRCVFVPFVSCTVCAPLLPAAQVHSAVLDALQYAACGTCPPPLKRVDHARGADQ